MPVGAGSIKRAARTADAAKNLTEEATTEKDEGKTKGEVADSPKGEEKNTESKRTRKTKNSTNKAENKESIENKEGTKNAKKKELVKNKKSEIAAVEKTKNEQSEICGIGQELPIYLL